MPGTFTIRLHNLRIMQLWDRFLSTFRGILRKTYSIDHEISSLSLLEEWRQNEMIISPFTMFSIIKRKETRVINTLFTTVQYVI